MGQNFLSCDREQGLLLPPDLGDWLPAGHLARFVIATVAELDLSGIYGDYRQDGHGRPAHDPAMMVSLVLYAYSVGVTSARAMERRCVEDVAFRYITADRQPDHSTIARFLVRHRAALSQLFFGVLALCQRAGMVRVGTLAVDSTKLAANASMGQNRTLDGLREEARRIVEESIELNRREDELYGDKRGDELPEELTDPRRRAARIRELLEEAEREREAMEAERDAMHERHAHGQAAPTGQRKRGRPPARQLSQKQQRALFARKYNLTDPDSGIVRHRGMLMQGYNVQTAVADGQIILATRVTGVAGDGGQLSGTVRLARAHLDRVGAREPVREVLADSGYWSIEQIQELTNDGLRVLVPPPAPSRSQSGRYAKPETLEMQARLDSREGKQRYQRRQQIIEPVFAHWKHIRQITRVFKRGRAAVQAEIDLIAATHNLLKLHTHLATA